MTPYRKVWEPWDAEELVSVHLSEQDARDAREQHLDRYRDFLDDGDLVEAAVEIRTASLSVGRLADHGGPRPQPAALARERVPPREGCP